MGKHGPCYHCGVTSTPLWRNGPADKPVLCNACGSRWRTKGTLVNYTPLHARPECEDYEDPRLVKVKTVSLNRNKDLKRKYNHHYHQHPRHETLIIAPGGGGAGKGKLILNENVHGFRKAAEFEEASNRSSSGSAVSNSESCAQFGGGDVSDMTGPAQSVVWESMAPSRKRTCVNNPPKQSSVEKLTKDLYTILQEQQSSYFSGSSSEDLLFESEAPMVSVEIGHGSVLIRHPNAIVKEEESEASSLSVENKRSHSNEIYSRSVSLDHSKGPNFSGYGTAKVKISGQAVQQEPIRREKSYHEIFQLLGSHNSPLCHVDLSDIVNSEEFTRHMTNEDQQKLLKYLPAVDVFKFPESLKSLFDSPQFKENLNSFQKLLAGGLFDMSFSEGNRDDCKPLKKLVLSNLSKSKWVEQYSLLKNSKASSRASVVSGPNVMASSNLTNSKRSQDGQIKKIPDVKIVIKSPKRVVAKSGCEKKEPSENDGSSCFSPRSLFAVPTDGGGSFLLDPVNFVEESSDQDLLLNVPSNGSFAQAELLHPSLSFGSLQASTSSSSVHPRLLRP